MPKLEGRQDHTLGVRKIRVEDAVGLHLGTVNNILLHFNVMC
jgi:hypothetical protein